MRELLLSKLRARLSLRQKFLLISTLKWLTVPHLRSFYSPTRREDYRAVENAFNMLQPYSTQYDEIRVGGDGDGGYVIPLVSQEWDVLISPGVGASSMFEMSIASPKTKVILIDANVPRPSGIPSNFEFINKLLGVKDSQNTITLDSIIAKYCKNEQRVILQMDIEGGEWSVLREATSKNLQKFQMIILELHNLENLLVDEFRDYYTNVLNKLSTTHFCSHFHVNNAGSFFFYRGKRFPQVVEVTLLNLNSFTPTQICTDSSNLDSVSDPAIFDWSFKF